MTPIAVVMLAAKTSTTRLIAKQNQGRCEATEDMWMNYKESGVLQYTDYEPETRCSDTVTTNCCIEANTYDWDGKKCGEKGRRDCNPENYFSSP